MIIITRQHDSIVALDGDDAFFWWSVVSTTAVEVIIRLQQPVDTTSHETPILRDPNLH